MPYCFYSNSWQTDYTHYLVKSITLTRVSTVLKRLTLASEHVQMLPAVVLCWFCTANTVKWYYYNLQVHIAHMAPQRYDTHVSDLLSMCVSFPPSRRRWRPVRHASPTWSCSNSSSRWCSLKAWRTPLRVPCWANWSTSCSPSWPSSWCLCQPWLTALRQWWKREAAPSPHSSSSCCLPCSGGTGTHSQDTHFAFLTRQDDDAANLNAVVLWISGSHSQQSTIERRDKIICENKLPFLFLKEKVYTFTFWKYDFGQPF